MRINEQNSDYSSMVSYEICYFEVFTYATMIINMFIY